MRIKRRKKRVNIVLFKETTGEIVRTIRFHKSGDFEYFLDSFNKMRYPGYKWKYANNKD
jgi:hypothetical protein